MYRLLVALLAAFDAAIAAAVGIAVVLAPLTLLWVFGIGSPVWGALWPASAVIWQLGHFVPLQITLPDDYLAVTGISADAASFVLSLAPLAFAAFTAIFASRSAARAVRAQAGITGVLSGSLVFAALAAVIALTSSTAIATPELWQAILFPALVFAVSGMLGAVVTAWRDGDGGLIDLLRDRTDAWTHGWDNVPSLVARGAGIVLSGMLGLGALAVVLSLVLRGGEVIALFEAGHTDALGATVVTLAQLAYIPTLAVWGLSFIAGPGFAVGAGTAVSPSGTQLGVVPGIPVLGALPPSTSPWLLLLVLLPIGLGVLAGWMGRAGIVARSTGSHDHLGARLGVLGGITVLSAGGVAVLAVLASGAMGPGRLAEVGPAPGALALALGLEVLVGAAVPLLAPVRRTDSHISARVMSERASDAAEPAPFSALVLSPSALIRNEEDRPSRGLFDPDDPQADRFSSFEGDVPAEPDAAEPDPAEHEAALDTDPEATSDSDFDPEATSDSGFDPEDAPPRAPRPRPAEWRPELGRNRPAPLPPVD
ncbi:MAG: hypothetical protein KKH75_03675 [Actinobacteria bacterium]|nr:hypothetical protein [Actinomycetota bacterium]